MAQSLPTGGALVLLREFQGLANEQTAQRLGLSVGAVKARVFHARRTATGTKIQTRKKWRPGEIYKIAIIDLTAARTLPSAYDRADSKLN